MINATALCDGIALKLFLQEALRPCASKKAQKVCGIDTIILLQINKCSEKPTSCG